MTPDGPAPEISKHKPTEVDLLTRHTARERQKIIGLLVIVVLILIVTMLLYGKMIPWGAR